MASTNNIRAAAGRIILRLCFIGPPHRLTSARTANGPAGRAHRKTGNVPSIHSSTSDRIGQAGHFWLAIWGIPVHWPNGRFGLGRTPILPCGGSESEEKNMRFRPGEVVELVRLLRTLRRLLHNAEHILGHLWRQRRRLDLGTGGALGREPLSADATGRLAQSVG